MHFSAQAALPFIAGLVEQLSSCTNPLKSAASELAAKPNNIAVNAVAVFILLSWWCLLALGSNCTPIPPTRRLRARPPQRLPPPRFPAESRASQSVPLL